jgi:hypothetical protein
VLPTPVLAAAARSLHRRSEGLLSLLERRLGLIVSIWLCLLVPATALRLALSPLDATLVGGTTLLPYALLVAGPVASLFLALHWFREADAMDQPVTRLALVGRWRPVSGAEARAHPLYGPSGIIVSLMIGMLIHIPVRAATYLASMPAITAGAPDWLSVLHFWLTLDAVVMSSLYAICFAAAFRRLPLFPRLLAAVWLLDLLMQLLVARAAAASDLPADVAGALHLLLDKNVLKVLISVGLWLPYLLLSTRVNVTYRHRLPA